MGQSVPGTSWSSAQDASCPFPNLSPGARGPSKSAKKNRHCIVIYHQAKRWENTVGRPEIHRFVGALHDKRAKKGVFLTTSTFSNEAIDYVAMIDPKVVLIDGIRLAEFMIDFNVGVSRSHVYEIKRIDSDYFLDE